MEEKRWAILIGINDYSKNSELKYSANDVTNLASVLTDFCNFKKGHIYPLVSTKEKHVTIGLNEICAEIEKVRLDFTPENDVIVFYFSGHGGISENEFNLDLDIEKIPLGHIFNELKILAPKYLIMIIDSCHSGKLFEFKGVEDISLKEYFEKRYQPNQKGFYLLASSAEKERSLAYHADQMGLYTKHFIMEVVNKGNYRENELPLENVHSVIRVLLEKDKLQIPHMQITGGGFIISNLDWHPEDDDVIQGIIDLGDESIAEEGQFNYPFFKELCSRVHHILSDYDSIVIGTIFNDFTDAGIEIQWFDNHESASDAKADKILVEDGIDWDSNVKMRVLWKDLLLIKSFGDLENDKFWVQFYEEYPDLDWDIGIKTFWENVFEVKMRFR